MKRAWLRKASASAPLFRRCRTPRQPIPPALPLRLRRLQPITERHQFIHLGDDAVLFGEGWEGKREHSSFGFVMCWSPTPPCA